MSRADAIADQTAAPPRWLSIVGIGEDGIEGLSAVARGLVSGAEIVFGGKRHLGARGAAHPRRGAAMAIAVRARRRARCWRSAAGRSACSPRAIPSSTASARCWRAMSTRGETMVVPAPSAFSLAAARLGWPLAGHATLVSLHGRALDLVRPHLQPGARVLALTSDGDGPGGAGRACSRETGFGASRLTVLEALGGPRERIRATTAAELRSRQRSIRSTPSRSRSWRRTARASSPARPALPTTCSSMTARSPSARSAP